MQFGGGIRFVQSCHIKPYILDCHGYSCCQIIWIKVCDDLGMENRAVNKTSESYNLIAEESRLFGSH